MHLTVINDRTEISLIGTNPPGHERAAGVNGGRSGTGFDSDRPAEALGILARSQGPSLALVYIPGLAVL